MEKIILILLVAWLFNKEAFAERLVNELPMYGETDLSNNVQEANRKLIAWANREFGDLKLASKDAAQRGWEAYYQEDLDTAIKRFNQAWLFNKDNPEVYWGFGIVMGQRASQEHPEKNLQESIRFLQLAKEKDPKNGRVTGDLAFSHTILGHYYKSEEKNDTDAQKHFETAGKLFATAFKADANYPPIVANWSVFYFYTEDYKKALLSRKFVSKIG